MNSPLLVDNVAIWAGERPLMSQLSFHVPPSSVTCVLGPTGSGKTRLLETVTGLVSQWSGDIILSGKSQSILTWRRRARLRGLLLPLELHPFPMSVEQRVAVALRASRHHGTLRRRNARARIAHALALCDLTEYRHTLLHALDKAVLRRVDFASLVAQDPPLWLLDEPNNYLERGVQQSFLDTIVEHIKSSDAGCLMTLHDTGLAHRYADQVITLTGRGQVAVGRPEQLLSQEALTELTGRPVIDTDRDTSA